MSIQRVLDGDMPYDRLNDGEQAEVQAIWKVQIEERIGSLDFAAEFLAAGESWTDVDEQGRLVERNAR